MMCLCGIGLYANYIPPPPLSCLSSVLRSIHMQLEMEPSNVAAEPPPQQHYIVL